jgi:hypothetical protein
LSKEGKELLIYYMKAVTEIKRTELLKKTVVSVPLGGRKTFH